MQLCFYFHNFEFKLQVPGVFFGSHIWRLQLGGLRHALPLLCHGEFVLRAAT